MNAELEIETDELVILIVKLAILLIQLILSVIARFFLLRKAKIPAWKAFVPFYGEIVSYKAVGMSGLWFFAEVPLLLVTTPGLKIPVWLNGFAYLVSYGVNLIFAINLVKAFKKKNWLIVPAIFLPNLMQLIIAAPKKSKYDMHYNRYRYRKINGKYIEKEKVKAEKERLLREVQAEAKKQLLAESEPPEKTGPLKKVTDFIVTKHKAVLVVVVLLAAGCGILATKVNINRDLTKYLPENSEMATGLNIMYDQFESVLAMPLSVMVDDLSEEEKVAEKKYLQELSGVASITYDDSASYNKDNHTLYELTISGKSDSKEGTAALNAIKKHYAELGKPLSIRGEVATANAPVLPLWVIAIAVISALVILIIMAESYVEPVLYLVAIGLAVAVNMGTNAFLPSVSQITNSITSVLQLALSMDYSIMLATEFHREKMRGKDKLSAMKSALGRSFTSISASSVTTIAGMLVLLLMSFTIGRDLGIVLAKGVLLCLFSIFTVLPALLLIFDGLVEKTKKRPFAPKLTFLGNISYKIRKFAIPIFLVIMTGAFVAQLQVKNLYTNTDSEAIDNVFGPYNQTVLVYEAKDEDEITDFCKKTQDDERTTKVLCYGNTINEPQQAENLTNKFASLGSKVNLSNDLIRFVYYHANDPEETHKISIRELVNFLQEDATKSETLAKYVNAETLGKINLLAQFTEPDNLWRWRNIYEISNLLDISISSLSDLMVLYGTYLPNNTTLTLQELSDFINNTVLTNAKYASLIPESTKQELEILKSILRIGKEIPRELADEIVNAGINIDEVLEEIDLDAEDKALIKKGVFALRAAIYDTRLSANDVANGLGVDSGHAYLLYSLYNQESGRGVYGISLGNLISFINRVVLNSSFANRIDGAQRTKLYAITNIINEAEAEKTGAELYELIAPLSDQIDVAKLQLLTIFHGSMRAYPEQGIVMTPEQFVIALNEKILPDTRLAGAIDAETSAKIISAKDSIQNAKNQLVAGEYGRVVIRSQLLAEGDDTMQFIKDLRDDLDSRELSGKAYLVGNSAMAYEMAQSFGRESVIITIVTAIVIYVVVAISFKSLSIPLILVLLIQTAVWITMTITGLTDGSIYFLSLIIVQSLLMGATIDYAIMYTEQYVAARKNGLDIKDSVIRGYNKSIQAILTSAGVLTIVTAIVGNFASSTAAKICKAISDGTFFSTILILLLLPALMAACDRFVVRQKKK